MVMNLWGLNANPLTIAKALQKYLLDKNSQEKDVDGNEDNNSIDTTNENKQYNKNRNMKQTIRLKESELKRMIVESTKRILKEGWLGNLFNGQNNEKPTKEQGIKSTDLPSGVYPSLKAATMGFSSQKYVIVYVLRTNWKTLYVNPYTEERLGINSVISKLRELGIKVLSSDQERFENPNWNGLNYNRKVEPKYGYGDGESADFTTLSWPNRM